MATDIDNLIEARNNISAKIVEVTANPKPNYYIDDKKVDWADYLKMLLDARGNLNALIAQEQPYIKVSQVL